MEAVKRNPNDKKNAIVFLSIVLIIFLSVIFSNNKKSTDEDKSLDAYVYSQQIVEENLKSPSSADFPTFSEDLVSKKGNIYTIHSFVDAQNSFGASMRNSYTCTLKYENEMFFVQEINIQ